MAKVGYKLMRHFTSGNLKGLSIPEKFFKGPAKVPHPIGGSPYVVRYEKIKKKGHR